MTAVPTERVAEVFVEVADTLVDQFDLIEFLHMVSRRAAELVNASAAGLLLADPKQGLQFMAASDESTRLLELFQVQAHDGPCVDAFRTGLPVVNADMTTASHRWPKFAPRAVAAGVLAVHAIPLRLRRNVIGALNLFSSETSALRPADVHIVQALADVAAIGILQERAVRRGEELTEQLQGALNSRVVIEQAKGAIAQQHHVNVDEAFQLLRRYARSHQRKLGDVARAIAINPAGMPDLFGSEQPAGDPV
ncbi:MAG: GAF and ANTAR domain-containing protein [Nocardioidaceae bacterium]|nr:GAF and ANTAR domain-containing protein [Nocardioidaceae bacterium]